MRTDGVLTPTRIETGSACHRRHVVADILEKGLYESPSAKFGNIIHAGTAEWWKSRDDAKVAMAALEEGKKWERVLNEKHSIELALAMLEQYPGKARLGGPYGDDLQVVTIEERLPVKLDGLSLTFQLDRLLSINNEKLVLVDTKTASRIDAKWRGKWNRSLQQRLYKALIEKEYDMPVDVVIEGMVKVLPLKMEYVPCPEWTDGELQEAVDQAKRIADKDAEVLQVYLEHGEEAMIEYALVNTEFNYEYCNAYGSPCPVQKICDSPIELRRGLLAEYIDIIAEY
jgi:hypothetical protein